MELLHLIVRKEWIMKKILLFIVLLFPFFVLAEDTCREDDIKIDSIILEQTQGSIEQTITPSNDNNQINLGLKAREINDSITYKVIIKNTSNHNYAFDKNSFSTNYLKYDITYEGGSDVIKAGETKIIHLNVQYINQPSSENLTNGVLINQPKVTFSLQKEENKTIIEEVIKEIINPETKDSIGIYILILIISLTIVLASRKFKKARYTTVLIILFLIATQMVKATCTCTFVINTNLEIDTKEAVFLPGEELNIKIKQLANPEATDINLRYLDTNITAIRRSETAPIAANKEENNIVSTTDSPYPIYMWFDNGVIYWWSEDKTPYLNENSQRAFQMLDSLVDISSFKYFDTSRLTIASVMFWHVSSLENIDPLSNWDMSNVTTMSGMFWGPIAITSLKALENWDISNVENMFATFIGTRSLINLEGLENWDVSKVTDMRGMFKYCEKIEDLDPLKDWDVSSVTSTDQMFGDNKLLKNIEGLKDWNMSKVEDMNAMFQGDTSLTNLHGLEQWDVSNVTKFTAMFEGATNITDASGINDWNIKTSAKFNYMFRRVPTHPEFSKVQGTWSNGTFVPTP